MYCVLFLLLTYVLGTLSASPAEWRRQSVYQVITDRFALTNGSTDVPCDVSQGKYCGGTWKGIVNQLNYIQNMGFTAIWISPITKQVSNVVGNFDAYHGYWQNDIYDLNPNFGTTQDLKDLSSALHARNMSLMVDVVVNHFATRDALGSIDYSEFTPFNGIEYFHEPPCPISDYNNQTEVELCWIGYDANPNLPDVNTTRDDVRSIYQTWIHDLVANYSIDGLRIDTVRQVEQPFWPLFQAAAGTYAVGEVFDGDPNYVCGYQDYLSGLLNYPLWYPLTRAFQSTSGSISDLANMVNTLKSTCKNTTLLGTFLENHDNPRFPSLTSDIALDMNAISFAMLADGIPIVYQGQEQHYSGGNDPYDREAIWPSGYNTSSELYNFIAKINQIRNHAIYIDASYLDYMAWPIYTDTTTIAMRKGFDGAQIVAVFSNKGINGASYTQAIGNDVTGFATGSTVTEILTCQNVVIDSSGNLNVAMGQGQPKIFYPSTKLAGSGICDTFALWNEPCAETITVAETWLYLSATRDSGLEHSRSKASIYLIYTKASGGFPKKDEQRLWDDSEADGAEGDQTLPKLSDSLARSRLAPDV